MSKSPILELRERACVKDGLPTIAALELPTYVEEKLLRAGINMVYQIAELGPIGLIELKGVGARSVNLILEKMTDLGYDYQDTTDAEYKAKLGITVKSKKEELIDTWGLFYEHQLFRVIFSHNDKEKYLKLSYKLSADANYITGIDGYSGTSIPTKATIFCTLDEVPEQLLDRIVTIQLVDYDLIDDDQQQYVYYSKNLGFKCDDVENCENIYKAYTYLEKPEFPDYAYNMYSKYLVTSLIEAITYNGAGGGGLLIKSKKGFVFYDYKNNEYNESVDFMNATTFHTLDEILPFFRDVWDKTAYEIICLSALKAKYMEGAKFNYRYPKINRIVEV